MTRVWGIIFLKERYPVGYSIPNDQNIHTMKKMYIQETLYG